MLSILASLAQEESRSVSENCTWGKYKRFADGNLMVNKEQAVVVKKIYCLFLQCYSQFGMVDYLTVHHDGKVEFTFLDGSLMKIYE